MPMFSKDDWPKAEAFAADHMRRLGFKDAKTTTAGADGGIDVESAAAVAQVKHWKQAVTRPDVQRLNGAAPANTARLFYAASGFTRDARLFADEQKIALFVYDLGTHEVDPVSVTAIRLDAALTSPIPKAAVRPADIPGFYSTPPRAPEPPPHPRAVQAAPTPRPLRWYFYVAGLTVSAFAWIPFLHAYTRTSDPRWRTASVVFGIWCPILYGLIAIFSPGNQEAPAGERTLSAGQSSIAVLALIATVSAVLLLITARNEVLDPSLRRPPVPRVQPARAVASLPVIATEDPALAAAPQSLSTDTPQPTTGRSSDVKWQKPSIGLLISSIIWSLSPFYTLGLGTPIAFLIAAVRRPNLENFAYMAGYLGVIVYWFATTNDTSTTVHMLICWLGANAHTFLVRRRVWYQRATTVLPKVTPTAGAATSFPE